MKLALLAAALLLLRFARALWRSVFYFFVNLLLAERLLAAANASKAAALKPHTMFAAAPGQPGAAPPSVFPPDAPSMVCLSLLKWHGLHLVSVFVFVQPPMMPPAGLPSFGSGAPAMPGWGAGMPPAGMGAPPPSYGGILGAAGMPLGGGGFPPRPYVSRCAFAASLLFMLV